MSTGHREEGRQSPRGSSVWFAYMLSFGGLCFIAGYLSARGRAHQSAEPVAQEAAPRRSDAGPLKAQSERDRAQRAELDQAQLRRQRAEGHTPESPPERPSITPLRAPPQRPLPQGHPQVPQTDRHGHPSFDCSALKAPAPRVEGRPSIAELLQSRGPAAEEVEVHAFVIGAYYGILGTNWYHLCDEPDGQVLVVSSDQRAPQRGLVSARGALLFDYNLSDVYRFPIYIKRATLSGAGIQSPTPALPQGVSEL